MSQSQGAPFHMDVPENRYWIVSSPDQIKEMDAAPQSVLSLLGAAKDLLQPKYTMRNFNWMEDKQGTEGATLIKTLRNDLTGHLPEMLPEIRLSMSALFDQNYESLPMQKGMSWAATRMKSHSMLKDRQAPRSSLCSPWSAELSPSPMHSLFLALNCVSPCSLTKIQLFSAKSMLFSGKPRVRQIRNIHG